MYDVIIVDGNNFTRRALHAHENLSVKKEAGRIGTGVIYGFYEILLTLLDKIEGNPRIIVAWDKGRKKRTAIYPEYKANRDKKENDPKKQKKKEEMNQEFKRQMTMIQPILRANGIYQAYVPENEADDTIGILTKNYTENGQRVLIASGDHDMLQLINKKADLYLARSTGNVFWDVSKFEKQYKIQPQQMIDVMSLEGDTTDNIPGVKGIGEAKALRIVQNNPDFVRSVLADEIDPKTAELKSVSERERQILLSNFHNIKLAYELVKIDCEMEGLKILKPSKDMDKLETIFEFLEFSSYLTKSKRKMFESMGE